MEIVDKDQGKLGDHSMDGHIIKKIMIDKGHLPDQKKKKKVYKDKTFGTWLYLEVESCAKLGKADR